MILRIKNCYYHILIALLGVCMIFSSAFYFIQTQKDETEAKLVKIVNYVKVQCSTYTHYNEASESKSLLRTIESCRQLQTNIQSEVDAGNPIDQAFLKENLSTLWMDGSLVLDENGNQVKNGKGNPKYKRLSEATPEEKALKKQGKLKSRFFQERDSRAADLYCQ